MSKTGHQKIDWSVTQPGDWLRRAITGSARPLAGKGFVTKLPIKFGSMDPISPSLDPCAPILKIEDPRGP